MRDRCRRGLLLAFTCLVGPSACGGASAPAQSSPPPTPGTAWHLAFSDEFDGTGAPDPSKWNYEEGLLRNNEAQYYTRDRRENARVEDGLLIIEARREEWAGSHYTSASLNTRNRKHFRYARIEVRAKLPTGRGTWPAIWMLGTNIDSVGWPTCGEVDIMENVGFDPLRIHFSIHTQAYNWVKGTQRTTDVTTTAPWENFHVYAIEWLPDRIDFFLDDVKTLTFAKERADAAVWPFDGEMYLLINLAIGGSWGGQQGIDDSIFPQRYSIDYVRVYERQ